MKRHLALLILGFFIGAFIFSQIDRPIFRAEAEVNQEDRDLVYE